MKILSDPATGVVLGGSIVGRHAAELISVLALAVTANLKVSDIVESCLAHPTLSRRWPTPRSNSLADDDYDVAGADRVAGLHLDLGDGARGFGGDVVLHLHGLEDADRLARLHRVAHGHEHLDDGALHGDGHVPPLPAPPRPPAVATAGAGPRAGPPGGGGGDRRRCRAPRA